MQQIRISWLASGNANLDSMEKAKCFTLKAINLLKKGKLWEF